MPTVEQILGRQLLIGWCPSPCPDQGSGSSKKTAAESKKYDIPNSDDEDEGADEHAAEEKVGGRVREMTRTLLD